MSKELAKQFGLEIGQKVLYIHIVDTVPILEIVTIKDIVEDYRNEVVILTDEHEGYLNFSDIHTQYGINKMFELSA